jgi:hypothetical protein
VSRSERGGRLYSEVSSHANDKKLETEHTLLNAVLLGFALGLGTGDALDALIKVVLGRGALLGIPAFCLSKVPRQPRSVRITQRRRVAMVQSSRPPVRSS